MQMVPRNPPRLVWGRSPLTTPRFWDEEAMKHSIFDRMEKMGGPRFLLDIMHFLVASVCNNSSTYCKCGRLVAIAQQAFINWLEQGQPANSWFMLMPSEPPDNPPNRLELWQQWQKKFHCNEKDCHTCTRMEVTLIKSAVDGGVRPPLDTLE